jgi:uncharacterized membrane protein YdcZ (DUF606 family)
MISSSTMQTRVRVSAALILAGLLVELLSLHWMQPPAFLVFAMVGLPIVLLGILLFLYSLVSVKTGHTTEDLRRR